MIVFGEKEIDQKLADTKEMIIAQVYKSGQTVRDKVSEFKAEFPGMLVKLQSFQDDATKEIKRELDVVKEQIETANKKINDLDGKLLIVLSTAVETLKEKLEKNHEKFVEKLDTARADSMLRTTALDNKMNSIEKNIMGRLQAVFGQLQEIQTKIDAHEEQKNSIIVEIMTSLNNSFRSLLPNNRKDSLENYTFPLSWDEEGEIKTPPAKSGNS